MTTASGKRWRLVTKQNGREHVSSVVLAASEVADSLETEAMMHEASGWQVSRIGRTGDDWQLVLADKGSKHRTISARQFDPMEDDLEERNR